MYLFLYCKLSEVVLHCAGEMMRYKQKQKSDGRKDPSLEYNNKLQEQIATQIRAIRTQSEGKTEDDNDSKELKVSIKW